MIVYLSKRKIQIRPHKFLLEFLKSVVLRFYQVLLLILSLGGAKLRTLYILHVALTLMWRYLCDLFILQEDSPQIVVLYCILRMLDNCIGGCKEKKSYLEILVTMEG